MATPHKAPVVVVMRFKEAGEHARKQTHEAVQEALEVGAKRANIRIERGNIARDYQLPADVEDHMIGYHTGYIEYPHDYGYYFEWGFRSVAPWSFMRPAGRAMKAVFKEKMGDLYKGWRKTTYIRPD